MNETNYCIPLEIDGESIGTAARGDRRDGNGITSKFAFIFKNLSTLFVRGTRK